MMERVLGEQVRLETQLDPGAGSVRIDRAQLEQILMNLAANARDAMPTGGTFIVRTRRVELSAEFARRQAGIAPGPYLLLTASDTGCGMDAETQARCFEPFFTTKAQGKGAGLGLSTAYGVLRQNGGHVRLETQPGRGTTFRIYLPAVQSDPHAGAVPLRQRTVLLVEDEDSVRHIIRRILQRDGFAVLEAADAVTALRMAEMYAASIDAVVADRVVPGAEPAALLAALEHRLPGVGIIRISGYCDGESGSSHGGENAGILLFKPFAPAELSAAMRTLLGSPPRGAAYA
jgi:two-component system, cell cycle sensor histidine kinase and response regulator CckA